MAKSAGEVIADRLRAGRPLSAFAVSQLRAQGQEGALRANAANVVRVMLEGGVISACDLAEAERYHPAKADAWKAAGGRVAKGRAAPSSASVEVPVQVETGRPLANARRERFAQLVASGRTQADAYREAYPSSKKWKLSALHTHSCELAALPEVVARVEALKRAAAEASVLGAKEFRERLTRQFRAADAAGDLDAMVKIGSLLAKVVSGLSEPTKVEVRDGGVTDDYREPPSVSRMGDDELRGMLLDEP